MLFRVLMTAVAAGTAVAASTWQRCKSTQVTHKSDSFCHRYHREVGFKRDDDDDAQEQMDARIAAARERIRGSNAGKIKSHCQRVTRWGMFERYCLQRHPDHRWSKWLVDLGVQGEEILSS